MAETPGTRDKLIQAGFELFHRNGYAATSIVQILKAAGANSGSLYYFFPTKEDLLIAVLEWCRENLWPEVIDPVFARVTDPVERVFGILDGYRKMLVLTDCTMGCPIGNLALELAESHPRVRALLAENFTGWRKAVEGSLRSAADRFPPECDLEGISFFVLTTMEGAVMLARTYRSLDAYDASVTQLREYLDRLLAEGADWDRTRRAPHPKEN